MNSKYQVFTDIVKFNELSIKEYKKLAELEKNGYLYSEEYKQIIQNIKLIVDVINKKLNNLGLTNEELLDYDDELYNLYGFDDEKFDFVTDILELNSKDENIKRLAMQIFILGYIKHVNELDAYIYVYGEEIPIPDDELEEIEQDLNNDDNFTILYNKTLSSTFMDYLLIAIENEKDIKKKNVLIDIKYRMIYITCFLEQEFLANPYDFTNTSKYQFFLKKELDKWDKIKIDDFYTTPLLNNIASEFSNIMSLRDDYFTSIENQIRAYLKAIYIKAHISMNINMELYNELAICADENNKKCLEYFDEARKIDKRLCIIKD